MGWHGDESNILGATRRRCGAGNDIDERVREATRPVGEVSVLLAEQIEDGGTDWRDQSAYR